MYSPFNVFLLTRFNGHDQRLERMMESALMVMEALEGFGDRYNLLWKLWKGSETGITCYGSFGRVWRQA